MKNPAAMCPKCGCPLTSVRWERGFAYCPECGESACVTAPVMAVPFTTTLDDFKRAIARALSCHDYVPRNVFSCVKLGTLRQVMVPVRKHSGLYRAEWTAAVGGTVQSGTLPGHYAIALPATSGCDDIPEGLVAFAASNYEADTERPWEEVHTAETVTLLLDTGQDRWQSEGQGLVRRAEGFF